MIFRVVYILLVVFRGTSLHLNFWMTLQNVCTAGWSRSIKMLPLIVEVKKEKFRSIWKGERKWSTFTVKYTTDFESGMDVPLVIETFLKLVSKKWPLLQFLKYTLVSFQCSSVWYFNPTENKVFLIFRNILNFQLNNNRTIFTSRVFWLCCCKLMFLYISL